MTTLRLDASNPGDIARAAELIRAGELVAMPTETVYGLAANALDPVAVAKIFAAKGRPQDNPLIVHVAETEQAPPLVREFPAPARLLAEAFWPGPLTVVLPKSPCIPGIVSAGLATVALRVPAHPAARELLRAARLPLAAPSANRSGSPSPTTARHVLDDMDGRVAAVLDGGPCEVGVESTVLSLAGEIPLLLRPGGVPLAAIEALLGGVGVSPAVMRALGEGESPASPGMKYRHYAPKAELTLVRGDYTRIAADYDGILCFDEDIPNSEFRIPNCLSYGPENDPEEQARQLYARLREIDELGWRKVLVRCPPSDGTGLAVYNRLLRAAAFREVEV